jgi:hypothetical protein
MVDPGSRTLRAPNGSTLEFRFYADERISTRQYKPGAPRVGIDLLLEWPTVGSPRAAVKAACPRQVEEATEPGVEPYESTFGFHLAPNGNACVTKPAEDQQLPPALPPRRA